MVNLALFGIKDLEPYLTKVDTRNWDYTDGIEDGTLIEKLTTKADGFAIVLERASVTNQSIPPAYTATVCGIPDGKDIREHYPSQGGVAQVVSNIFDAYDLPPEA